MAELKDIRIAVSGIYDYAFGELPSLGLDPSNIPSVIGRKDIYRVYRPSSVLAAAVDKFKLLPLTHHHPSQVVDGHNFRELAIGYTGENPSLDFVENRNEIGIRSSVVLYDDEALDAYNRGEIQLSPGYHAVFEWQQGTSPNGQPYDIIMKNILDVNHLALLPAGRGGPDAVILDHGVTIFDIIRGSCDGAPYGNDNASKDHVDADEKGNDDNGGDSYPEKNYPEYKGKGQDAVDFIVKKHGGQVRGAFHRPDLGDIDIVWGKVTDPVEHKGYGLAHIIDKHGDDYRQLGNVIKNGVFKKISEKDKFGHTYKKSVIDLGSFRVIVKHSWDDKEKNWIVTGYERNHKKGNSSSPSPTTDYMAGTSPQPSNNITPIAKRVNTNLRKNSEINVFDYAVNYSVFDLYR